MDEWRQTPFLGSCSVLFLDTPDCLESPASSAGCMAVAETKKARSSFCARGLDSPGHSRESDAFFDNHYYAYPDYNKGESSHARCRSPPTRAQ